MYRTCFLIGLLFFTATFATASNLSIMENSRKDTIDCAGGSPSIDGDNNELNFTGECSAIAVGGNGNTISIEAVGAISVLGNNNKVVWARAMKGVRPVVSNFGKGNTIQPRAVEAPKTSSATPKPSARPETTQKPSSSTATPSARPETEQRPSSAAPKAEAPGETARKEGSQVASESREEASNVKSESSVAKPAEPGTMKVAKGGNIAISDSNANKTIDCDGGMVSISGDTNTFKITGSCSSVAISGDENKVTVENVSLLMISGDENEIHYSGKKPLVTDTGDDNTIEPQK